MGNEGGMGHVKHVLLTLKLLSLLFSFLKAWALATVISPTMH